MKHLDQMMVIMNPVLSVFNYLAEQCITNNDEML